MKGALQNESGSEKESSSFAPSDGAAIEGASTLVAEVIESQGGHRRVRLSGETSTIRVQLAVWGDYECQPGDRVLVHRSAGGEAFVIGVLDAPRPHPLLEQALRDSASPAPLPIAEVPTPSIPTESIPIEPIERVFDDEGALLFEYDRANNRARLHIPQGDLKLEIPAGALHIGARDGVHVHTEAEFSATADSIRLSAGPEAIQSTFALKAGVAALTATSLNAVVERGQLLAAHVQIKARTLGSQIDKVKMVSNIIEQRAQRSIQRFEESYLEVEGLSQVRAGRIRWAAKKAMQVVGQNVLLKARDRMKVKGERIHLA